jgi:hypothetical protein
MKTTEGEEEDYMILPLSNLLFISSDRVAFTNNIIFHAVDDTISINQGYLYISLVERNRIEHLIY